ncbi:AAA family ATPase, partial [Paenibacillus sepulcri]|nr:AAA family ATPase [Paenibacillus sepulcri]
MRNYIKEIALGFFPVLILFLQFIVGLNMIPLVFFMALVVGLLYVVRSRGNLATIGGERKGKPRAAAPLSFDEIGGQERAKQELVEALDFLVQEERISKFGIRPLKGILLAGPPGTGKTLLAKAAATYTDSVYVAASGSEFVEMYVGV